MENLLSYPIKVEYSGKIRSCINLTKEQYKKIQELTNELNQTKIVKKSAFLDGKEFQFTTYQKYIYSDTINLFIKIRESIDPNFYPIEARDIRKTINLFIKFKYLYQIKEEIRKINKKSIRHYKNQIEIAKHFKNKKLENKAKQNLKKTKDRFNTIQKQHSHR